MRHPSVIADYVGIYHEERKRLASKSNAKRAHLELRLGEINREIGGLDRKDGSERGTRTPDPRIMIPVL
jgi:hypothetical protein